MKKRKPIKKRAPSGSTRSPAKADLQSTHFEQSETLLNSLVQAIPDPAWVIDASGAYLICNPVFEQYCGLPENEIIGKTAYDLFDKITADDLKTNNRIVIEERHLVKAEVWLAASKSGYKHLFEILKAPMYDNSGGLTGILSIGRDITEMRNTQRDLRERVKEQQFLYWLFSLTEDLDMPFTDLAQLLVDSIPVAWQYPGITAARLEYAGMIISTHDFVETPWMLKAEASTRDSQLIKLSIVYLEEMPVEDEGQFFMEERYLANAIVHRMVDVIDRRHTAEILRESLERYKLISENSDDVIWLLDPFKLRFTYVSPSVYKLRGYTPEEVMAQPVKESMSPESFQIVLKELPVRISSFMAGNNSVRTAINEIYQPCKDGHVVPTEVVTSLLFNDRREVIQVIGVSRDITQRKKAEEALVFKTTLLECQSEASPDGILIVDNEGHSILSNLHFGELWKIPQDILDSKDDKKIQNYIMGQLKDQEEFNYIFTHFYEHYEEKSSDELALTDGRFFERHSSPLITADGKHLGRIWFFRDITDRKHMIYELNAHRLHLEELVATRTVELADAIEKVKISEERFALALDASTDGLWDWNMKTNLSYCSPSYFRMLGYEPYELGPHIQEHFYNLLHPDDRQMVTLVSRQRLANEGAYEIEFRMRSKDGRYVWILSRGKVVTRDENGNPVRAIGTHTDLSLRKQLEIELRKAGEEQRAIVETATTGILLIWNRMILRCNRKLEEIFGYDHDELLGKTTKNFYKDDETYAEIEDKISRQLADSGIYRNELQLFRKDRTAFWARTAAQYINKDDASGVLVGIIEDITAERNAAEALRIAKELAETANRAKSDFLANMSHEIRTPMNAIIGMSHLMLKTGLTEKQRDYMSKIEASGEHLMGIINDILDLSKIEAGKFEIEKTNFELEQILSNISIFLNQKAGGKDLEFIFDIAPEVPNSLVGDSLRLSQILINYCGNAVKFTEHGEICIIVRARECTATDAVLYFAVRDTGIGLTDAQKEQLFQSFKQADMSTTRKYGGTGLGLVISKQFAEKMGGEVGVESEYGRGSTFWFTVRLGISPEQKHLVPEPDLRGCRVLLVDDSEAARITLNEMLQSMSFNVTVVSSGKEAVQEVQRAVSAGESYRIIFLDWKMPGMNGIETARKIDALKLDSLHSIIMVTAFDRDEALDLAGEVNIDEVLTKPITPSMLFDAVMRTLHGEQQAFPEITATDLELEEKLTAISGSKILLVEDNMINQEVAVGLLVEAGLLVDTAENGEAALDKMRNDTYDLVLMDMQMPVMDGITAAREIRKIPELTKVPIVAMTANAMRHDRDNCLAAGMNDFITKPINASHLWSVLLEWIKPRRTDSTEVQYPSHTPDHSADLESGFPEQIAGLDIATGLQRMLRKKPLYIKILRKFLYGHKNTTVEIMQALDAGDRDTAERLAHTIKGVAGNIGAIKLQSCATDLQQAIMEGRNLETVKMFLSVFDGALRELVADLEVKLPPERVAAYVNVDPDRLNEVCQKLEILLKENDSEVNDLFDENFDLLSMAFPDEISAIHDALNSFDFGAALSVLSDALKKARYKLK